MSSDPMDPKLPDLRYVRELARMFKEYELDELEIETDDQRMLLRRANATLVPAAGAMSVMNASAPFTPPKQSMVASEGAAEPSASAAEVAADFITSPFVGTFYRSPRPDAPSFVDLGAKVKPGQTVCIIEAMKLFNEIEADFSCTIEECLVENGQPVEYGARLFRVRKL